MISRRKFFSKAVVATGAAALGAATRSVQGAEPARQPLENPAQSDQQNYPPGEPGKDYTPVITPNGSALPYKLVGGIKVFHLIAEEVDHEFTPVRNEQASGKYQYSLAWSAGAIGYGWSRGT